MSTGTDLHIREIPASEIEIRATGDGLTVEGLVVPYGVETEIVGEPCGRYREMFVARCAQRAERAPNRVGMTFGHDRSFAQRIGYGLSFRDSDAGLVGELRLYAATADHARDVLSSSHAHLSVGFVSIVPAAGTERAGTLQIRRSVHLDHVAAVESPAYAQAAVLGIRQAADELLDDGQPTEAEIVERERLAEQADLFAYVAVARREQAAYDALRHP
jgi:phage head maturation protease